jgi:hypothetical protein
MSSSSHRNGKLPAFKVAGTWRVIGTGFGPVRVTLKEGGGVRPVMNAVMPAPKTEQ